MTTTTAAAKRTEQQEAIVKLKTWLKPGDTVYTILKHVSASGMSRSIELVIARKSEIINISFWAARAMDRKIDQKNYGIKVGGCGMDLGFELVHTLGRKLFPNGFVPAKTGQRYGRNGTDANVRDNDGGYALNQRWI